MPTEDIQYRLAIVGSDGVITELANVSASLGRNTNETVKNTAAVTAAAPAHRAMADAAHESDLKHRTFGAAIAQVTGGLRDFNPLLGEAASVAGHAWHSVESLTESGLGPMGIALGVTSAAFELAVAAMEHFHAENDAIANSIQQHAIPALQQYLGAIHAAREERRTMMEAESGGGGADTQEALAKRIRDQDASLLEQRTRITNARIQGSIGERLIAEQEQQAELTRIDRERQDLHRQLEEVNFRRQMRSEDEALAARTEAPAAPGTAPGAQTPTGARGGGRSEDPELARMRALNAAFAEQSQWQNEIAGIQRDADAALQAENRQEFQDAQMINAEREKAIEFERQQAQEEEIQFAARQKRLEDERRTRERLANEQIEHNKQLIASVGQYAQYAGNAFAEAIGSQESFGKAFVRSVDNQLTAMAKAESVKAIVEGAEALGSLAILDFAGAGNHAAAAAMHGAAAAAAGLAAAAITPAASPSGGSTSAGSGPARSDRGGGGGEGNTTVVVNFGGAVVTAATEAELGRKLGTLVQRGSRLTRE